MSELILHLVSDTHFDASPVPRLPQAELSVAEALRLARLDEPALSIVLGDITDDSDPASIELAKRALPAGMRVVAGNHDMLLPTFEEQWADWRMGVVLATPWCRVSEVVLESCDGRRATGSAEFSESTGGTVVLVGHYPLIDPGVPTTADPVVLDNSQEFLAQVRSMEGPVLLFHGHTHRPSIIINGNFLQLGIGAFVARPLELVKVQLQPRRVAVSRTSISSGRASKPVKQEFHFSQENNQWRSI